MRPVSSFALALLLFSLASLAGCGSSEPRPSAEPPRSAGNGSGGPGSLWDMPQMRRAQAHRQVAYRELEAAYGAKIPENREAHFKVAYGELEEAQVANHEAPPAAPERYRPVIEKEIEGVAERMRQIQRDRASPPAPR
jgi:hypothetical protein